jgi:DNA helicase-2/ATP-dependent DNA helicase PcrA
MLRALCARKRTWPAEMGLVRSWYEPHLERIHEDFEMRRADLLQLEDIAAGYPSRERFLTELTLDPPDATSGQAGIPSLDEDYLILSTIHSAKGQEWKSVFVINCVDGCIPSDLGGGTSDDIEEERRLLYVAMTRAKDRLGLIVPQRFFTHGSLQPATAMCMRPARVSFQGHCFDFLNVLRGRSLPPPAR